MAREAAVTAAVRRVRWRERIFGLARPLLPDGPARWTDGAPILLYHRVVDSDSRPDDPFAVAARAFDWQIAWLAEHFTVVTVRDLVILPNSVDL